MDPQPHCETDPESDAENFAAASDLFEEFELSSDRQKATNGKNVIDNVSVAVWDHDACVEFLRSLPQELGIKVQDILEQNNREPLSGKLLLASLESVRELRDTFGLDTIDKRLAFEREVTRRRKPQPPGGADGVDVNEKKVSRPMGSQGGVYDPVFLDKIQPLYDMHMGVENMGPLLYTLIRFTKPRRILEVGAGYTSIYILQALRDNHEEMMNYQVLKAQDGCHVDGVPWCVDQYLAQPSHSGLLHCMDSLEHKHTTAFKVLEIATELGLDHYMQLHVDDAFDFPAKMDDVMGRDTCIDMVWADFGAGERLDEFFGKYWARVNPNGGFVLVHSTLTNRMTRTWLQKMQLRHEDPDNPLGAFHHLSLLEPHKLFQNSVSIFQRRGFGYGYQEPVYTVMP